MNHASKRWGVELGGTDTDKKIWRVQLKLPFDPFVEEVKDDRGDYLVLRSTTFECLDTRGEVHNIAKQQFEMLNASMSANAHTDPVTIGAVVEFVENTQPRKHHFVSATTGTIRIRAIMATATVIDAQGSRIEAAPMPSQAQLWMRAAALDPAIGSALRYINGKPGWVELYKAYEVIRNMPRGDIPNSLVSRFTQTANAAGRHQPSNKHKLPKIPMELSEAHDLMNNLISTAIQNILTKNR